VNLDWRRLRAVVLESDDWGLCAWSPDEQALRALADTPAFRTPAGRRYGGSTLEHAADVDAVSAMLGGLRGADGFAPCLQANTIMAAPDYAHLHPPLFEVQEMPLVYAPETPSRWRRPGLWDAVARAREAGTWWPELHGLHHLPEAAWLRALRRGEADARRAHACESPVCLAAERSSEYDPSEPVDLRTRHLERAVAHFVERFGRRPASLCPPDYRWDDRLESDAQRLGITIFQGKGEQVGVSLPRLRRQLLKWRWPNVRGPRFFMPPRIAFEPGADLPGAAHHVADVRRAVRDRWQRGQPAALSSHRCNYVHLDASRATAGRTALRDLLAGLCEDGATFLVDAEVRDLQTHGWSVRDAGARASIARYFGVPREPIRFPAPAGATAARFIGRGEAGETEATVEDGSVVARLQVGEYRIEWNAA